ETGRVGQAGAAVPARPDASEFRAQMAGPGALERLAEQRVRPAGALARIALGPGIPGVAGSAGRHGPRTDGTRGYRCRRHGWLYPDRRHGLGRIPLPARRRLADIGGRTRLHAGQLQGSRVSRLLLFANTDWYLWNFRHSLAL